MMRVLAVMAMVFMMSSAQVQAADFTLSSPQLTESKGITLSEVYNGFGCTGKNISPDLIWKNAPAGTKSFAISVYDPDAPTGSGWWHWLAFNIPAGTTGIKKGAGTGQAEMPAGTIQSISDFDTTGYGGPCPPVGDKPHRYIFKVYALKVAKLDLSPDTLPAQVGFNINANKLGEASFEMTYGRK